MAYFPRTFMPLTEKANPVGSSRLTSPERVTAEEYNLHDREIRAIQEYLGVDNTYPVAGVKPMDPEAPPEGDEDAGIFDKVNALINDVNGFVDQTGGANMSSGYMVSGRRLPFPESAHATYLSRIPSTRDTTITVNSTLGFPSSGVISILNNVDVGALVNGRWRQTSSPRSMVEWIRYGAKNGTQFLQCQRAYMGSGAGNHNGIEVAHGAGSSTQNLRDDPGDFSVQPVVSDYTQTLLNADGRFSDDQPAYGRRNPGWRQRYGYVMNLLLMGGTLVDITWRLMRRAGYLRIDPAATDAAAFASAAGDLGLLGRRRSDGTYFLESQDTTAASQKILTWEEADALVTSLVGAGVIVEKFTPDTWRWPAGSVPVFQGRMHVNYAPANIGRSVKLRQSAMQIIQFADGTAYGRVTERNLKNKLEEMVSMIQFNCFFLSAESSSIVRDGQIVAGGS